MKSTQGALEYANTWVDFIHTIHLPETRTSQWVIQESLSNFSNYFNRGWIEDRKSVRETGMDAAAVEWNGKGAILRDILGREYIDWLGGYGLLNHGWSHPEIVAAVKSQLELSPMPSQELIDPLRGALAHLLADILPGDLQYSFFAASGTEAVEGALKLAKMYTKKSGFITTTNAFHGKTLGALSVIGKAKYREPVGALYGGPVFHVPYGDLDALEMQLSSAEEVGISIAAMIIEPVQGEAGGVIPPDGYLRGVRELTKRYGVLMIADEVQTGLGRTGKLWGVDHEGVVPDIMTLGKSLGGGVMPISAFCSTPEIWESMMSPNPFIHTTTTGGNPLACAAAITAIQVMLRDDYAKQAHEKGEYMMEYLQSLAQEYSDIYESITGRGLLIGQHFRTSEIGYKVSSTLFAHGVMVAGTLNNAKTIRIEPPIIISYEEINQGLNALKMTLREVQANM